MAVKGSKQYKTKVVPHRPLQRALFVCCGTLLLAGFCAACLWLGYQEAQKHHQVALNEWDALNLLVEEQKQQIEQLISNVSNTQVGSDVDKLALETLRQEIIQLKKKTASLEESNNFYRKLMEPKELTKGLAIGSFTLTPSPKSGEYHYQLVVQQFAKDPRTISGKLNVTLIGTLNNKTHSYALHEISPEIDVSDIPFSFRFYQSFEGNLSLPKDFDVQRIDVLAERAGSSTPIVRSFDLNDNIH